MGSQASKGDVAAEGSAAAADAAAVKTNGQVVTLTRIVVRPLSPPFFFVLIKQTGGN